MADEFTDIFKLAKKATKGNWVAVGFQVENERDDLPDICNTFLGQKGSTVEQCVIDAEYISAVQPKNVIAIIQEIRQLRRNINK